MSSIRSILEDAIVDNIPEVDSACLRTAIDQALKDISELIEKVTPTEDESYCTYCWDRGVKEYHDKIKELLK